MQRFLALLLVVSGALRASGETPPSLDLPPRPADAPVGAELSTALRDLPLRVREENCVRQIFAGNVPDFWRAFRPVTLTLTNADRPRTLQLFVAPDYLAIGHDTNFLRAPLSPMTAQRVADRLDCSLPTPAVVDAIWRAADVRLAPEPMPPGPAMTTMPAFAEHHARIEQQRAGRAGLLAGHKKDVVVKPGLGPRVAIYGWHQTNGSPIQPLYAKHAATWVDYSHGIRLVANTAWLDGRLVRLPDVLPGFARCDTNWPPEPAAPASPERRTTNAFGEVELEFTLAPDVRVRLNRPPAAPAATNDLLVFFALPNGNTLEQTFGRRPRSTNEWRYDIQHIAAQTRFVRAALPGTRVSVAGLEAGGLSWPAWRKRNGNDALPGLVAAVRARAGLPDANFVLSGHSGGGSFIFGYLAAVTNPPAALQRIAFLDANYAYDTSTHRDGLLRWLGSPAQPRLIVLAYEDYVARLDGKPFVSAAGGTWGRSRQMLGDLGAELSFHGATNGALGVVQSADGRVVFLLRENPERKIWHTVQVERNGFIYAVLAGTAAEGRGYEYFGPRAYGAFIAGDH